MSKADSQEIREIAQGATITWSAVFDELLDGQTIASVNSVEQYSGPGTLTIGTSAVNSGSAVTVGGVAHPVNTVIQFEIEAQVPSSSMDTAKALVGTYRVDVWYTTSGGDVDVLRCWLKVTE